ncbi:MAG: carboxypeptidase regulatory-like domain-containing protein [Acetobacteraceae bacterium]|nr:carboxypeptidase regulatory-like domain-containing protein [Acetobacteraceae bacterium]
MRITGLVVDKPTNAPIQAARVAITREGKGDEVASLRTGADGRFAFDDDLNEYLGQHLAFTVEQEGYKTYRSIHQAERGLTINIAMVRNVGRLTLRERLVRRFRSLTRPQRLALAAAPVAALGGLLTVWWFQQHRGAGVRCDMPAIRDAAKSADAGLLWTIADRCAREGKGELHFTAVEQCAMREHGPCLMTMAGWYDPEQGAQPTPFRERNAVRATEYYRRARNQGVEEARPRLDALCRALRQKGGQEAAEASC